MRRLAFSSVRPEGLEPPTLGSEEQGHFTNMPCFIGFLTSSCIQFMVGLGANWIQSIGYRAYCSSAP